MLHELLLSLSGHPSPLLSRPSDTVDFGEDDIRKLLSPAESALLESLSEDLGERHKHIREHATSISSSHTSTVCRAVAASILSTHLAAFQRRILEVEKNILQEDPSLVGAYNTVPLSAIVSAFDGWGRKLAWLWDLVQYIQKPDWVSTTKSDQDTGSPCSAAMIIQKLRDATRTGYPDIATMSLALVRVAELAWLKQLSAWVLYGLHPGGSDFFVVKESDDSKRETGMHGTYIIRPTLVPCFVLPSTAKSVLFIGKSLNHIKDRQSSSANSLYKDTMPELGLFPVHLSQLSALQPPISSNSFSEAVVSIRVSLSQNALQKLLPFSQVLDVLRLLLGYFLLARGEFAIALITSADERLSSRHQPDIGRKVTSRGLDDLASLTIREGEVQGVLARTWTALASLHDVDDDDVDEELDRARELITLSIKQLDPEYWRDKDGRGTQYPTTMFDDLLLPSSSALSLRVPSPLDLFLTSSDVDTYSDLHAYLLSIRRAHLHLSKLFQLSVLRRNHPSPRAKVTSNNATDFELLSQQRRRANEMAKLMRPIWATIGSAGFFLAELGEYFQGEVIQSSWATFSEWLVPNIANDKTHSASFSLSSSLRPGSSQIGSRPTSSRRSDEVAAYGIHDPETLTQAHQSYLSSVHHSILLDDAKFTSLLRRQMTAIEHLCALMQRLDSVHQNLKVADESDASSNLGLEERKLIAELQSSRIQVAEGVRNLIARLRDIDDARAGGRDNQSGQVQSESGFVPWSASGLDRLLLKFDYGSVDKELPSHSGYG